MKGSHKYNSTKKRTAARTMAVRQTAKKFNISTDGVRKILRGARGCGNPKQAQRIIKYWEKAHDKLEPELKD